ncbi:hypothetical protein XELAEV_18037271mg [Xenopus laevis]|uniref:Uncharacterized protein n=1 Tax=Xenopus laevis TaxID=8355 RepID=A0A974HA18_XENLA|nr:hypothetical protein XELAEV_18037271mg [Xenopus laevis]
MTSDLINNISPCVLHTAKSISHTSKINVHKVLSKNYHKTKLSALCRNYNFRLLSMLKSNRCTKTQNKPCTARSKAVLGSLLPLHSLLCTFKILLKLVLGP